MPQPAVLHVIGGNDRGKNYELVLPETRIGRGADQDLVLADIAVSRRHVTIHAEGGRYRLRDLGSGNGTLVNGSRVDSVLLNDGDQIELGNTLMRFDHAASRAQAPGAYAPPPLAPPPPYASPASAPVYAPPVPSVSLSAPTMAPPAIDTPSGAVLATGMPAALPPSGSTSLPIRLAAPFVIQQNRLIAFGVMGLLSFIFLVVIIAKSAFAKPAVAPSDAEELYRQGLKLFAAKDYEGAKVSFGDALPLAPDSPELKRYLAACDLEVHARGAMQNADRAIASRRYAEAVKALDQVDSGSLLHDDAVRKRKEYAPRAAMEDVDEARRLQQEDPDTARAKLQQALTLDPGNADARALAARMHVDLPPPPATNVVSTPLDETPPKPVAMETPPPAPQPVHAPSPVKESAHESRHHGKSTAADDDGLAPVKMTHTKESGGASKMEGPSSAQAMAAYKAKDFATAERLYRLEARNQSGRKMEQTIAFANQIRDLKALVDKAGAEEGKSPAAAAKDYQEAMAIDARVGRGVHAGFFKQHLGKLEIPLAQQAFSQGRYDVAFNAVQQAQHLGAGDGGMLRQLEAKAKELTDRGAAMQKSNPGQAKMYWHQVLKMVPTTSPQYSRAYQLLNQNAGGHKDEDED